MATAVIQPIATIVAPSAAAGIAAYLGIRLGLQRYAREKAFDVRRDWYEQAVRVIFAFVGALKALSSAVQRGVSNDQREELFDELVRRTNELAPVMNLAYLYASPTSLEASLLLSNANSKLLTPLPIDTDSPEQGYRFSVASLEKAARFAKAVGLDLAMELRQHLGLEPLSDAVVYPLKAKYNGRRNGWWRLAAIRSRKPTEAVTDDAGE